MGLLDRFRKRQPSKSPRGKSGRAHTQGFLEHEELNQQLVGIQGLRVYDRMYRTDPDVRRVVGMVVNPIVGGTWSLEPHGGDEASERDREAASATEWALKEVMRPGLPSHLAQALPIGIRSGFAPFEQVWGPVEWEGRTLLAPKHLGLRLPRTILEWHQKGEELDYIKQLLPTGGIVELPATDLVYYRFGAEGDNWEGTSLLRAAYKPWFYKDLLEKIDAIKAERQATGVPVCYPPEDASPEQLDEMEEVLAGLRSAEQAYIIAPGPKAEDLPPDQVQQKGWRIEILTHKDGESTDLKPSLEYHSDRIAAAFIAEFMRLGQGQGSVGARATADVQQAPFLAGVEAIASVVETALQESVVARFTALNFDVDAPPKLTMSLVDDTALDELADYVAELVEKGVIEPDDALEDFLRERADLPPADREAREARRAQQPQTTPPASEPEEKLEDAAQLARQDRPLRWWERHMALDAIESRLDEARARFEQAGGQAARALAARYARRLGEAPNLRAAGPLADALGAELAELYEFGRATVQDELSAQRREAAISEHGQLLAEAYVLDTPAERARQLRQRARAAAAGVASRIWQAVSRLRLNDPGADRAALQATGEAEAMAALRAEAQVNAGGALAAGRDDEAQARASEIRGARYTSILDGNRCEQCEVADDDVLRPLSDPVRLARRPPNPDCYGGGRCRCMEFFQLKSEVPGSPGSPVPLPIA